MMRVFCGFFLCLTPFLIFAQHYGDIYVSDKVRVQRCVIDGSSSRMIAVGHPGGFNFAFDAVRCAPAFAWFGAFLDFSKEANGRGGGGCEILGIKRPFGLEAIPLRIGNADELPGALRFGGYRREKETGNPTFLVEVDGIRVEQRVSLEDKNSVSIALRFLDSSEKAKYYRLNPAELANVELSKGMHWRGRGVVEIPAAVESVSLTITFKDTDETFVRKTRNLTGAELFRNYCSACHSIDGSKLIGPSFKGIWGREQIVVRNGKSETVTVDEAYVRESISFPQASIARGYEQTPMADFSSVLSSDEIDRLVKFLREID